MIFSIGEFPANIYTFITHGLVQVSNIHTLLTYGLSSRFYFSNREPKPCTSIVSIHEPYFFPYLVLNTNITFKLICIHSNTITKFIPPNCCARNTSATPERFLHILQLRFTQVTQLSGFYFSKKELAWMCSSNKFFLLIISPRVLS